MEATWKENKIEKDYPGNSSFLITIFVFSRHWAVEQHGPCLGYDRNRIIRPEPEPEFRFRLAGTGSEFSNSGSGMKNRNKHFEIPVPVQKNRN